MTTFTVAQAIRQFGVEIDQHLEREVGIPVNTGLQRQGDVLVRPWTEPIRKNQAGAQVPTEGFPVVRGENGGNTHLLLASGEVLFRQVEEGDPSLDSGLRLGFLTVAEGATAYLAHPEHGYLGIGTGTYVIGRQREQADVVRRVAD